MLRVTFTEKNSTRLCPGFGKAEPIENFEQAILNEITKTLDGFKTNPASEPMIITIKRGKSTHQVQLWPYIPDAFGRKISDH